MAFVRLRVLGDAEHKSVVTDDSVKLQFSIQRVLAAIAVFSIALALFHRAVTLNACAFATIQGPVVISIPALTHQWVASSITVGGIAVIPFGWKGFLLGSLIGGVCVPLLLTFLLYVRAGGNL